jgi:subfamily B ATP-binding cassette protein MsbA
MIRRFRPYFSYLRPQRGLLIAAILCGILAGVASGFGLPYMVKKTFPAVFAVGAAPLTAWELARLALWIPAVFVVRGVATYFNTYLIQLVGTRVLEAIRLDFFRKLQVLPLSFFQKNSTGDLLSRGLSDANQLQVTLTTIANEIVRSPASLIGSIAFIAWTAYTEKGVALVLVILAVVPLSVLPIRYVGKKLIKRAGQIQAELGGVTQIFSENLSATKEVRAFSLEDREVARFGRASQTLIRAQMKFVKYEKALAPLIEIVSAAGISLTLIYAYKVGLAQETFITLITALYASYEPIKKLGSLNNEMKRGLGALERLEAVLQAPVSIVDASDARALTRAAGALSFENVSFSYQPGELVLNEVSVQIPAGTVCALVGPSGAGKSTFAHLVPRFFDPVSGRITLDGHDLRSLRLADLRRNIAVVSQDPVLFNDTIYHNLLIARPASTRTEIEAAARAAYAHDFVSAFPDGYDTLVGERQPQHVAVERGSALKVAADQSCVMEPADPHRLGSSKRGLLRWRRVVRVTHARHDIPPDRLRKRLRRSHQRTPKMTAAAASSRTLDRPVSSASGRARITAEQAATNTEWDR